MLLLSRISLSMMLLSAFTRFVCGGNPTAAQSSGFHCPLAGSSPVIPGLSNIDPGNIKNVVWHGWHLVRAHLSQNAIPKEDLL